MNRLIKIETEEIKIDSIGSFEEGNNVIFFKPDQKSEEYLKDLFEKVTNGLKPLVKDAYKNYNLKIDNYNPHITIAEKIPEEKFKLIKQELSRENFDFSFKVDSIYLFKQEENSREWIKVKEIKFE